ncbi:hypothetical protein JTE90_001627 [Oedothorax gibbosus]|uniref:Helitron helicase-like domain-containing protein n=1 Tax=Oedothorax gibbosus TaxID=931172 RepID=A0AAV6VPS4_9ARAC|nr:hypothetical protein JTE90_001627 [Oedothorax gibbosus]
MKTELLDDILKRNLFGVVVAYIYVIRSQKRGLPHAHMLLTLYDGSKKRTKDDIDKFAFTELSDADIEPCLYELIISKCMIHGPC